MSLAPGTKAVIKFDANDPRRSWLKSDWNGFEVEVVSYVDDGRTDPQYRLRPLSTRPDGYDTLFFWDANEIHEADHNLPVDTQGRVIRVGDKVVYPNRSGSWLGVITAKVVGIDYEDQQRTEYDKKPGTNMIDYSTRRTVTVAEPVLRIEAESQKFVYDAATGTGEYVPTTYRRKVRVINRVTVVN